MKKTLLLLFITFAVWPARADLDPSLIREIKTWRPGDDPPKRLIKFPDGEVDDFPTCGMRVIGSAIEDYIATISDDRLLVAIMFDWRSQDGSIRAAARQLLKTRGPSYVAAQLKQHRLDAQRTASPEVQVLIGGELAALEQLLASPCLTMRAATISAEDMTVARTQVVMTDLKAELESGASWATAYGHISHANPDLKDPSSCGRTLVAYAFDGVVSPIGFDLTSGHFSPILKTDDLAQLFRVGVGVHVLVGPDGVVLYQVTEKFAGPTAP